VQVVLVERPVACQRVLRGRRHLVERFGRGEPLLGGQALHLLTELHGELIVIAGDQGASVERVVAGCERVDGPADDVGDDEVAGVDRGAVGLARHAFGARCQSQQRRVAGEV
jgi:hypothetical protein